MKKDLGGKYFGQLKVIKYVGNSKYLCECKCGNLTEVHTCNLTNGHTQSCGCLAKKKSARTFQKRRNGNVNVNVEISARYHKIILLEKTAQNLVGV